MKIDEQRFFEDGYLIIREAVPADQLADLRLTAEILVDRCKARSEANRGPGGPRGGEWYAGVQPRVTVHEVVDEETASVVDFLLGPTVHGGSHQIMGTPESAITSMQITCSGLIDYGHTDWHRDSSAREQATVPRFWNARRIVSSITLGFAEWACRTEATMNLPSGNSVTPLRFSRRH